MTSPLPPKRRDTIGTPDLLRQDRIRLGQLDRGLVGGRYPPARPLRPPGLGDGDEDDVADGVLYAWEWNDRHTVTSTGTQHPILSHAPVDEALTVHWHPKGRGGLPVTSEFVSVDGNKVTIVDPAGLLAIGDQYSFQYPYDPDGEDDTPDAFTGLTLVGAISYYGAAPHPTSFALPGGTAVGDLIVVGAVGPPSGGVMGDTRLTSVVSNVWTGRATDLTAVQLSNIVSTYWAVMIGVFRVNADPSGISQNIGSTAPASFPQIAGSGAIAVACGAWGLVDGSFDLFAGSYTQAGHMGTGKAAVSMGYWADITAPTTPAQTLGAPSVSSWSATTIGFGG